MAPSRLHLLSRFRKAVAKVRFVLSFNLRRWILSSAAASTSHRRLSFDNNQSLPPAGLLAAADEFSNLFDSDSSQPPMPWSSASMAENSGSPPVLLRTISRVVSGGLPATSSDDINQRAEDFIHNFYRQLRMERQISLELRYCNGKDDGFLCRS